MFSLIALYAAYRQQRAAEVAQAGKISVPAAVEAPFEYKLAA
jgi:hypothetical protein